MMGQKRAAAIAAILLVWLPSALPQSQRMFGQCYVGTTPTRCEPVEQTFSLNRVPTVNSTCGMPAASYCVYQYTGVIQSNGCNYTCNSSDASNAHPPSFLTDFPVSSNPTWWQSKNNSNYRDVVFITLNLAAIVEVTKVALQFRTLVPMSFYIEKSVGNNQTFTLFNTFQSSCTGQPTTQTLTYATETTPLCTLISSPIDFQDTVFVPTNGRPSATDLTSGYSQNLYDFIQATNIRVILQTHFPISGQNASYYYAIQDLNVVGRFQCNGHAASITNNRVCNCQHNTTGVNCEQCLSLYNDIPWERNDGNNSFECQMCNCNQHSTACVFDASMYNQTGGVSGGVCINCSNNTAGIHCETCAKSFYPLPSKNQTDPDVCAPCNCDARGMNDSGECQQTGPNIGSCYCKANVLGPTCSICKDGYFNISSNNVDGCQDCGCNTTGSLNSSCTQQTGLCYCKSFVIGQKCDYCQSNYYQQSPSDPNGCQPCNCTLGGSLGAQCDIFTGQCPCRDGVTGRDCSVVVSGHFFPLTDYLILEAEFSSGSYQKVLLTNGENTLYTGTGIASMSSGNSSLLDLGVLTPPSGGWYQATFRYSLLGDYAWSSASLQIQAGSEVGNGVPSCTEPNGTLVIQYTQWGVGNRTAIEQNVCLRGGRSYHFVLKNFDVGIQEPGRTLDIDSFFLTPIYINGLAVFNDNTLYTSYSTCVTSLQTLPRSLAMLNACRDTIFEVSTAVFNGTLLCACNTAGSSNSSLCNEYGGQCPCSVHIGGLQCGYCIPGYFNFSSTGCQACNCNPNGSSSLICSTVDGSCPCVSNVTGRTCSQCASGYYNLVPGVGCSACNCDINGSVSLQCQQGTGSCTCKTGVVGSKCDHCNNGYYGFSSNGCSSCNCSPTGTIGGSCDATTGVCLCATGASGRTCASCLPGYYANSTGYCQACNCNSQNSISQNCTNGTCTCIPRATGATCNGCTSGYYKSLAGLCTNCGCNTAGSLNSSCTQQTGMCYCKSSVTGQKCDHCSSGYYNFSSAGCLACNCNPNGSSSLICSTVDGSCPCVSNVTGQTCSQCAYGYYNLVPGVGCSACNCNINGSASLQCQQGTGSCTCKTGVVGSKCDHCNNGYYGFSSNGCSSCNCRPTGTIGGSCDATTGVCLCATGASGRTCASCLPGYYANSTGYCQACNCDSQNSISQNCTNGTCACIPGATGATCNGCTSGYYKSLAGLCTNCGCNTTGSLNSSCTQQTGMCYCKSSVTGQKCDHCTSGYYSFSSAGCQACNCNPNGSSSLICSTVDGSCPCVSNVTGQTCSQCAYGYYNLVPGVGCSACNCNINGSASLQCQQGTGICTCNPNVAGDKCDRCVNGYYGLTNAVGCSSCNCSPTGTIGGSCDATTGVCLCATGASGRTCASCLPGYYANSTGYCQACNCDPQNSMSQNCTNGICNCIPSAMGTTCEECIFGYYKTPMGLCTVCSSCYSQAAAIVINANNTLSLNYYLLQGTILPNKTLFEKLSNTSNAVTLVCVKTNDTAKLFLAVESALSILAVQVVQLSINTSQTMDLLNLVEYDAAVVYVNAIAAISIYTGIEEQVVSATDCIAKVNTVLLPQLQGSADSICNYVAVGQQLYDEVVNFSSVLQNQLNKANNSLSRTWQILASVNSIINQAMTIDTDNLNFIAMLQVNVTDGEAKLSFVKAELVTLNNNTESLLSTITKLFSMPIILPLTGDLISLWNHTNITLALVEELISEVNSETAQGTEMGNELVQLQTQFGALNNELLQLMNSSILNSNAISILRLATDTEFSDTNSTISNAANVFKNLQMFKNLFSRAVLLLNGLLNKLADLKILINNSSQLIGSMQNIVSNFNGAASTVNDTATTVRYANDKVLSVNSSLSTLMLSLVQASNNSNMLINEAAQANAKVQTKYSESQEINNQISILESWSEQGSVIANLSNQSVNSVVDQWSKVKSQLQSVYNQSFSILYRLNTTKTLSNIVQQQANSTVSIYQRLSITFGIQQRRRLQLEANIEEVQSSVQYLRQLRNVITTKCNN